MKVHDIHTCFSAHYSVMVDGRDFVFDIMGFIKTKDDVGTFE
jgi:hypothetical protein